MSQENVEIVDRALGLYSDRVGFPTEEDFREHRCSL